MLKSLLHGTVFGSSAAVNAELASVSCNQAVSGTSFETIIAAPAEVNPEQNLKNQSDVDISEDEPIETEANVPEIVSTLIEM